MRRRGPMSRVVFLLLMLSGWPALAQQGAGVLVGTVRDTATRRPVADVVVTATSPGLQGEEIAVTDAAGNFRVANLPPGKYTLRMEKETYKPYARSEIALRADMTLRLDAELLPESLKAEQTIIVVGRAPTVDVGSSQVGTTVDAELMQRVPVARPGAKGSGARSFESVATVSPQAKSDDFGVGISGTTSPENSYVIDGLSVGDPAYGILGTPLSMEFIKELNVITGGYMPEYGKATGGILNVVTKSGSNDFKGSFWAYYTPGQWGGAPKLIKRQGQTVDTQKELRAIYDLGADFAGPILKDKLWFYLGFDYSEMSYVLHRSLKRTLYDPDTFEPLQDEEGYDVKETLPGTQRDYTALTRTLQLFSKLNYAHNPQHRFSLTFLAMPSFSGGGGNFAFDPQRGVPEIGNIAGDYGALASNRDESSLDAVLKWSYASHSKKFLIDTTFGWHHQYNQWLPADGSTIGGGGLAAVPEIYWRRNQPFHSITDFESIPDPSLCARPEGAPESVLPCSVTGYYTGGPGFLETVSLNRYQLGSIATLLGRLAGSHVVKLGVDLDLSNFSHLTAYSGGVYLRESTSGGSFTDLRQFGFLQGPDHPVLLPSLPHKVYSLGFGGFAQDSWNLMDRVTLNAGLRYDAQYLFNTDGDLGLVLANQWSPRVGVIYDPSRKGRAKVFANYAIFYESMPLDIADRASSGDPQVTSYHPRTSPDCSPRIRDPKAGGCVDLSQRMEVNGSTSPDKKWVITGGSITPVDPDLSPQSSSEIVLGGEYDIIWNARAGLAYTRRWMNNVVEDMSRDEAQTYFIGNPGKGIARDFPEARRDYDAVSIYLTREFLKNWLVQLSYTLSYLRGNYAGLYRPETFQLDPNINSDFDLKSLVVNRDGPLPGDSRHNLKLFGAYEHLLGKRHGLTVGGSFLASSGGPTSYLGSHPLYGEDEVFILPRGSGPRLPWTYRIDLHLGYRVRFTPQYSLALTLDMFNLFNFQEATAVAETFTTSDVQPIVGGTVEQLGQLKHTDGTPFNPSEIYPNFGKVTSYQAPRSFRLGLRGEF